MLLPKILSNLYVAKLNILAKLSFPCIDHVTFFSRMETWKVKIYLYKYVINFHVFALEKRVLWSTLCFYMGKNPSFFLLWFETIPYVFVQQQNEDDLIIWKFIARSCLGNKRKSTHGDDATFRKTFVITFIGSILEYNLYFLLNCAGDIAAIIHNCESQLSNFVGDNFAPRCIVSPMNIKVYASLSRRAYFDVDRSSTGCKKL